MLGNVTVSHNRGGVRFSFQGLVGECAGRRVGEFVAREGGVCRRPDYRDVPFRGVCAQDAVCCGGHRSKSKSSAGLLRVRNYRRCLGLGYGKRYGHFFCFLRGSFGDGCAGEAFVSRCYYCHHCSLMVTACCVGVNRPFVFTVNFL